MKPPSDERRCQRHAGPVTSQDVVGDQRVNWIRRSVGLKRIYNAETAELAAKCPEELANVSAAKTTGQCPELAKSLGTSHSLLRLSAGDPKNHLHHQRN